MSTWDSLNYKCIFGNHLHGSDSWNPGSESAQSVERENYLEQYLEEYIYVIISVKEGERAKRKHSERGRAEKMELRFLIAIKIWEVL